MQYLRRTLAFKKDFPPRESSRARTSRRPLARGAILGLAAVGLAAAGMTAGVRAASATTFWPQQYFAPYVDTDLGDVSLTTLQSEYGTSYFTLAFADGSGCQWSLPDPSYWQGQVSALRARGGDVAISFGGEGNDNDGTDLGNQCSSPEAMAAQVENVVNTYGVTHLDFDIEGSAETNGYDNQLTAQALAEVQSWAGAQALPLYISYTLPATPSGLDSTGLGVLQTALDNGFRPDIVNMMSFDYGQSGIEMGQAADQAIDGLANQLTSLYNVTISQGYEMVGVTSMIGQNDSSGEVFTLTDAETVESYAAQAGITELSIWSENRDNGNCAGDTAASATCSGISQSPGEFTSTFQQFTDGTGPYVVATGQIASGIDGYCLDDFGGTGAKGVKADLWPCNDGAGQIWNYMSNGALEINGLCLDASNQGTADKTLLILWPCNGQANQQWYQQANGEIVGAQSGRCVDDPNYATANGPQQWLWDCNDGANQQWWGAA
jgi:hypothetical protein